MRHLKCFFMLFNKVKVMFRVLFEWPQSCISNFRRKKGRTKTCYYCLIKLKIHISLLKDLKDKD